MIRILAPVISVRNVTLTQSRIRMFSYLASNDIDMSLELDPHDDTCVIGKDCLILNDYERPVTVYGYYRALGAQSFRTVSDILGYIDLNSGQTYHLVIHQAIKIPHLEHSLICPMQFRMNGVEINETPPASLKRTILPIIVQ